MPLVSPMESEAVITRISIEMVARRCFLLDIQAVQRICYNISWTEMVDVRAARAASEEHEGKCHSLASAWRCGEAL